MRRTSSCRGSAASTTRTTRNCSSISTERAVKILRKADRAGLMHTSDLRDELRETSSICNCCTDCCHPHLATKRLGMSAVWPMRRHVAAIDTDSCKECGRCGLRCPFDAIACRHDGRPESEPSLCRGCGLCATGCSSGAIALLPLTRGWAPKPDAPLVPRRQSRYRTPRWTTTRSTTSNF